MDRKRRGGCGNATAPFFFAGGVLGFDTMRSRAMPRFRAFSGLGEIVMGFAELSAWIDGHVEEMVELQVALAAAPAQGPEHGGEGEWEKSRLLEAYLGQHGFPGPEHFDTPDERVPDGSRPNWAVILPGEGVAPRIWLMTHMDVVPPGDRMPDGSWAGWDSDPFAVRREGDRLIGRGVEDNQQEMVASVFAVRALIECGVRPAYPVGLLFVSAEETGSAYGLNHVLREHPELFDKQDIILVPDGGNEDGSLIEVSEKSVLWLKFRIKGKQSHGSMPHRGCNAFRAGARLVCALDAGLPERFSMQDELYEPPRSTFEPTMHEKNVPNVNTTPGEEVFCFDCRVLPQFDLDEVLRYVRSQLGRVDAELGTESDLEILNRVDAAPRTPADVPAVGVIQRAVAEVYGVEGRPMGIGGGTVAVEFRRAGYPVVVWSRTESTAHQTNESCLISNMVGDAKVYAHIFCQELP